MSPDPKVLLAKSPRRDRKVTLAAHSLDTEMAAVRVFGPEGRWGRAWRRFFKLAGEAEERFLPTLRVACVFHDLGKANEDFLAAVQGTLRGPQTLRHEHLSALLLHMPEIRCWLTGSKQLDVPALTAAVLSHHLKAAPDGDWKWGQPRTMRPHLRLYLGHPEVRAMLDRVACIAGLGPRPEFDLTHWKNDDRWQAAWVQGRDAATALAARCWEDEESRRFTVAVKAGVIVADSVSSGLVREGLEIEQWIDEVVHAPPIDKAELDDAILTPRARSLEQRTGRPFAWHAFQEGAARQGRRALLLAGCGAGKTLAAWRWAQARCGEEELGRVVFLYPTRGTANEGFRDYVGWAPEADAALVHGSAAYDLEGMVANPSEATQGRDYGPTETEARLFALGLWNRKYFSATVDQFLSFMENRYSSLCLLPALADAAVIIDEVHSFDGKMFGSLCSFLREFDVPVLCMTATLPRGRRDELLKCGLRVYPGEEDRQSLRDLEEAEQHPRYHLQLVEQSEAFEAAVKAVGEGRRVLWVVNTVARCQGMAKQLRERIGADVICYHSRFRLKDRQQRHTQAVAAFQQAEASAIAVTTQVCEMSLDLDADVLISEIAPLPSMIQRFGRANRHRLRGNDFRAEVLVYPAESAVPYGSDEIEGATSAIVEVRDQDLSQLDLARLLDRHAADEVAPGSYTRFLHGGYYATPGEFRDANDFTLTAVLEDDLEEAKSKIDGRQRFDGLLIDIPRGAARPREDRPGWLPGHLGVAPGRPRYDPDLGFLDKDLIEPEGPPH